MPDNTHSGHRARLRERFEKEGLDGFQPHEVLELLLFYAVPRRDTNELAHRLLERFGSLDKVFDAGIDSLIAVDGIGYNSAVLLRLMQPAAQYYMRERFRGKKVCGCTEDMGAYMCSRIGMLGKEVFVAAALDSVRRETAFRVISDGLVTQAAVQLRRLAEFALSSHAESLVIAHNHVSGRLEPSQSDRDATSAICRSLLGIGVKVTDHIIVCGDRYYSFAEAGILPV